jgi:hypothetical protein
VKEVREWLEADLELVVEANEKENVSIDYKDSRALDFSHQTPMTGVGKALGQKHREDLIRDVAAMANAEGGLIIYGIAERNGGYPDRVDNGIDPRKCSADRITQILVNNIHPRLEGIFIRQIELTSKGQGTGNSSGVLTTRATTPAASSDATSASWDARLRLTACQ